MKTKTPSLDEKLKKLVMRHGWITEQDDWLQAIDDIKEVMIAWAEGCAPKELDEGDGWDIYFNDGKEDNGKKRSCCPGDDIAYAHNEAIKQYKSNLTGSKSKKEGKE